MTHEEITEFNKICADFLGYQILKKQYQYKNYSSSNEFHFEWGEGEIVCDDQGCEVNLYEDGDPLFSFDDLPFTSDWNWIMEVIDKIECTYPKYSLQWQYDEREEFAKDGKYTAYWFTLYPKDEICNFLSEKRFERRIESVVNAVYEFLILHKNNKM